eukprot:215536-Chlamydomonas_euryale.AAC.1
MLAAGGGVPSCLILPVAAALHSVWRALGTDRFLRWADMALLMSPPPGAGPVPWLDLHPEHRAVFLQELVSPECADDVSRFKLRLGRCGGARSYLHYERF